MEGNDQTQQHVNINIPSLFGGISHQPATIRHPNQVEDALNTVFSVVDGASKRPGSILVTAVNTLPSGVNIPSSSSGTPPPPVTSSSSGTPPASSSGTAENEGICVAGDLASTYITALIIQIKDAACADVGSPVAVNVPVQGGADPDGNICRWAGKMASGDATIGVVHVIILGWTAQTGNSHWTMLVFTETGTAVFGCTDQNKASTTKTTGTTPAGSYPDVTCNNCTQTTDLQFSGITVT